VSEYIDLVNEVLKEELEVIQEVITEDIEPLVKFGSPEKLIGKPYEFWTPVDKQLLAQIYGNDPNSPLVKLIVSKEFDKLQALKAEVV
jgi:hypothetical protein